MQGRLTKDVELKYTQNKKAVARFNIAVKRNKEETDFISCIAWDKTAEFISKYFKKGSLILVTGRIQTGHYTDKDSKEVYTTDVIVEEVEFCGGKKEENEFTQDDFSSELPF